MRAQALALLLALASITAVHAADDRVYNGSFTLPLNPNPIGPSEWTPHATSRSDSAAISVGEVTIIAGGWNEVTSSNPTRSADLLIFNGSSSFDLYFLPTFFAEPRTDMAVASAGRGIVFAGGSTASNINDDKLYCYNVDSQSSSATQCGQLIVGRRGMGAAGAGDLVLFVGGWNQTAADDFTTPLTVYSDIDAVNTTLYMPISGSNNKWHLQTGDPRISSGGFDARAGVAACTVRDRYSSNVYFGAHSAELLTDTCSFMVFGGGYDGNAFSNSVFVFDISDWSFTQTAVMLKPVWYAAAACTGNVAVFMGGASDEYGGKPCYYSGCAHSHLLSVVEIRDGTAESVSFSSSGITSDSISQFGRGIAIGSSVFFRFAADTLTQPDVFGHPDISRSELAFKSLCDLQVNPERFFEPTFWTGCPDTSNSDGRHDFFFVANHNASVAFTGGSGKLKLRNAINPPLGSVAELTSDGGFGYNISTSGQFPITTDSPADPTSTNGPAVSSSSSVSTTSSSSASLASSTFSTSSASTTTDGVSGSSLSSFASTTSLDIITSSATSSEGNSDILIIVIITALNLCIIVSVVATVVFIRHRRRNRNRHTLADPLESINGSTKMSSAVSRSSFGTIPSTGKMTLLTDVILREQIGQGNFGAVWLAAWRGTPVACKALTGDVDVSEIEAEATLLASLNHPNIVNLLGMYTDTSASIVDASTFLVFEYADGGSVLDAVRRMSLPVDPTARQQQGSHLLRWMLDAARGMEYVASRGVVHRDLGCRNLLLSEDHASVCDFGLSRMLPEGDTSYTLDAEKKRSTALPVRWCPKELLQQGTSSELSDSYSFGIVLWEAFSFGALPFTGRSNAEVVVSIIAGQTHQELAHPPGCPDEAYHLALQCWSVQPEDRPRFTAIRTSLESILEKMPGELSSPQYSTSFLTSRSPGSKDPGSYRSPSTAGLEDYQSVDAAPGSPDYQSIA